MDGGRAATCMSRPSSLISLLSDLHLSVLVIEASQSMSQQRQEPKDPVTSARLLSTQSQSLTAEPFALGNPVQLHTICVILSITVFAEQNLFFIVVGGTNQTTGAVHHAVLLMSASAGGVGYNRGGFAAGSVVVRRARLWWRRRHNHGMGHDAR